MNKQHGIISLKDDSRERPPTRTHTHIHTRTRTHARTRTRVRANHPAQGLITRDELIENFFRYTEIRIFTIN